MKSYRVGAAALLLFIGCATTGRWNPASAVADAERDIASSQLRFAYVGGFVPFAPGLPLTDATYKALNRYGRLAVGPQGCVQDERYDERREYASHYNLRMWSYVSSVFVTGEVNRPGNFPWTNGITAAEAILLAGGLNQYARRSIQVLHWDGSATTFIKLTPELTFTNCVVLKPGDMVYSPKW